MRPLCGFGAALVFAAAAGAPAVALAQEGPGEAPGHAAPGHDGKGHDETAGDGSEHGGGEHEGPGPINWFDFSNKEQPPYAALLINFGLLAYGYYRFGKQPVADALKKNRESIAKDVEEAQRMKREAEARAKQYQAKLQHLETELADTKAALEAAGKAEHDRIVREAEEKAARMQKDAAFMLEQESKQLRLDIQRETIQAALTAAEDLLKKRVTSADQERLAEEFLSSLDERAAFGAGKGDRA